MKKTVSFLLILILLCSLFSFSVQAADPTAKNRTINDLWMKVGVSYACDKEVRVPCDPYNEAAAPYREADTVLFPLAALTAHEGGRYSLVEKTLTVYDSVGKTRATLTLDGKANGTTSPALKDGTVYIELAQAAGIFDRNYYYSDTMGMFAISETGLTYDENVYDNLVTIVNISRKFLFDNPSEKTLLADFMATTGFGTHPRLLADEERFDFLRDVYNGKYDGKGDAYLTLKGWLNAQVADADLVARNYFAKNGQGTYEWKDEDTRLSMRQPYLCYDENGEAITPDHDGVFYVRGSIPKRFTDGSHPLCTYTYNEKTHEAVYTLYDDEEHTSVVYQSKCLYGDGYDEGERLNEPVTLAKKFLPFGFAYQLTGNKDYADMFYLFMVELGKWITWGDGHFLNAADTSASVSLIYDWTYHAFDKEPEKQKEMAQYLYDKVVFPAYWSYQSKTEAERAKKMYVSYTRQGGSGFITRDSNWNPVCTSGSVMAALLTLDYEDLRSESTTVAARLLETVQNCFIEYAPDGAYAEGAGYWGYASNTFFRLVGCLLSACDTDYGLMNMIGMDNTVYFARHMTNSDYVIWAYADCAQNSTIDSDWFFFPTWFYGNPDFAAMRRPTGSLCDIIYFDPGYLSGSVDPSLDYFMKGAQTVSLRSGWEKESNWIGLHVGPNISGHSDMDSGNFILEMDGIRWFSDVGSENYNIGDYFGRTRYLYFRKSVEAHNVVFVRSSKDPDIADFGQAYNSFTDPYAKIVRFESNEGGAIAVADMTPQYGKTCTDAKRAVMLTASRNVAVVEDELNFSEITPITWVVSPHVSSAEVSADGKTATITYSRKTLRLTLLSPNKKLKFEKTERKADTLLPKTIAYDSQTNRNPDGSIKYDRATSTFEHLIINGDNLKSYKFAVVMQVVDNAATDPVGYEYVDIDDMIPITADEAGIKTGEKEKAEYQYLGAQVYREVRYLPKAAELDEYDPLDICEKIANIEKMIAGMDPASDNATEASIAYREYMSDIEDYIDDLNKTIEKINKQRSKIPVFAFFAS